MESKSFIIDLQFDTDVISTGIENILAGMSKLVSAAQAAGDSVVNTLTTVNKEFAEVESISSILLKCFNAFNNASSGLDVLNNLFPKTTELVTGVYGAFKNMFAGVSTGFSGMSLGWGAIIAAVVMLVTVIVQNWDAIKTAIGTAAEWINSNVIQPVAGFFSGLWDGFKEAAANAWKRVTIVFSTTENIL